MKHEATAKCLISDKARTASVLNGLKKTHLMSSLAKQFLKSTLSKPGKSKLKFM